MDELNRYFMSDSLCRETSRGDQEKLAVVNGIEQEQVLIGKAFMVFPINKLGKNH